MLPPDCSPLPEALYHPQLEGCGQVLLGMSVDSWLSSPSEPPSLPTSLNSMCQRWGAVEVLVFSANPKFAFFSPFN